MGWRRVLWIGSLAITALTTGCSDKDDAIAAERARRCAGPPLTSVEQREELLTQGYVINHGWDCIDRESWEAMERQKLAATQAAKQASRAGTETPRNVPAPVPVPALEKAREGFKTAVSIPASGAPLPDPPPELFVRSDYKSPQGRTLAAYVTPDPGDGEKHPAIVWLTGGDSNSLDDFWIEGTAGKDQSASAYRKAGLVMMFPTLRGGNTDTGRKEFLLGEVDDVVAAAEHLARLPYVNAQSIYLGGHSTGGTLVLLTAEASTRFKAVFAFGPVSRANRYAAPLAPELGALDLRETILRSPIEWLEGVRTPTWLIEGAESPGNREELDELCAYTRNPAIHCIAAPGFDHFTVLEPVSRVIAARLVVAETGVEFSLRPQEFRRAASDVRQ